MSLSMANSLFSSGYLPLVLYLGADKGSPFSAFIVQSTNKLFLQAGLAASLALHSSGRFREYNTLHTTRGQGRPLTLLHSLLSPLS